MEAHETVSRDELLAARRALLAEEKALLKAHDALAAKRRALPWVEVEKSYVFDGPDGVYDALAHGTVRIAFNRYPNRGWRLRQSVTERVHSTATAPI